MTMIAPLVLASLQLQLQLGALGLVQDPAVPAPETVRDEAASAEGPVRPPEVVRDEAAAGQGAVPPPGPAPSPASPPNPQSRPSEGVFAVGSSGIAPLPPPPPPLPRSSIARGRWSGVGWLSVRLMGTGPIAGFTPARPSVIALGGGVDGGWRIRQWLALGAGFSRQPHEISREPGFDGGLVQYRGHLSVLDLAFMRIYAPVRGRVDPYIEVGGGLAFFDPARERPTVLGGSVRASAGVEFWIARHMTLGLMGIYRANVIDDVVGHAWQAGLDLGVHW
jgi:hypothetical protein